MSLRIDAVDILDPDSLDLAQRWSDVYAAVQEELFGADGSPWQLSERQALHRTGDRRRRAFVAREEDGSVVGSLELVEGIRDNLDLSHLGVAVPPGRRRRGVGSALLDHGEELAHADGRHVLTASSEFPVGGQDLAEGFAARHGWTVAQTAPRSALTLHDDVPWRRRLEAIRDGGDVATTADPDAFVVEAALGLPPDAWYDGLALMYRRMSTDIPLGDLALEEEEWDADRVRGQLTSLVESGRRLVTSVARRRDADDAEMVGFTELSVSAGTPELAYQGATLVLREARGHRIGLRLKAANVLALLDDLPQVRTIRTWNADENAPMLAVNRELGFVVDAWERSWQKRLS